LTVERQKAFETLVQQCRSNHLFETRPYS
jgi:hypothetical protein